jgi:hypothetical protein
MGIVVGLWSMATLIHSLLGGVHIDARVVPANEPPRQSCPQVLTAQGEGITLRANRDACHVGHGKVWFRATVTTDGDTQVHCDVRAFDHRGRELFQTFLPVGLVVYPFGPTFRGGHPRMFVGFFPTVPNQPVDHYEAGCGSVPGSAI